MASNKQQQILELTPANELRFDGPFDTIVTSFLQLYNPSDKRVCFKVKTTAPRRYCVRPNSGIIEPSTKVSIAIMLQPFDNADSSQNDRNKHKFMVQSVVVGDEEGDVNLDALWKNISNSSIMDSKLKCVFHMPNPQQTNTTNTTSPSKQQQQQQQDEKNAVLEMLTNRTTPSKLNEDLQKIQQSTNVSSTANTQTTSSSPQQTSEAINKRLDSFRSIPVCTTAAANTVASGDSTAHYGFASQAAPSKAVSSQANISSGSLNASLQSFEEQKATLLIAALFILILGIILGKYII